MGAKMLPLLAAVDGMVHRVTFNNTSTGGNSVTIKGADGWTYHYLHVNNDTPGTDDGQATRAQAFPRQHRRSAPRWPRARSSATWATPATPSPPARTSTSRSASRPPPGSYTGHADQPLRVAPAGHRVEQRRRAGTSAAPRRRRSGRGAVQPTASMTGDRGLLCDWDGDGDRRGRDLPGGTWYLRDGTSDAAASPARSPSAPPTDTPLCGDLDGDGSDEPVLFRKRHLDRPRRLRHRRRRRLDRAPTASRPATSRCWATGTATATTTSRIHRGGRWHIRSTRPDLGGTVATLRLRHPATATCPSAATGTATATTTPASSAAAVAPRAPPRAPRARPPRTFTFGVGDGQPLVGPAAPTRSSPGIGTFRPRTA